MTPGLRIFQAVEGMMLNSETPVLGLCFPLFRVEIFLVVSLRDGKQHWLAFGIGSARWSCRWRWGSQAEGAFVNGSAFLQSHC